MQAKSATMSILSGNVRVEASENLGDRVAVGKVRVGKRGFDKLYLVFLYEMMSFIDNSSNPQAHHD